ncbi:hypothetical protein BMETH_770_1 [methanotrophic bacterial endosymbiont of Bathymodiolus sp.]|nr:hypothetical protein BMETH_770_1 [methanotrophic bacterial endosymbiont of Bathymodiolus sp.]
MVVITARYNYWSNFSHKNAYFFQKVVVITASSPLKW